MNKDDANVMFGSANVEKVKKFKINGGNVDFGDHLHIGGAPQGDAIIVWSIDGRAAVKGVLFSDNFNEPQTASIKIRFRRNNGNWTNWTTRSVASQSGPMLLNYTKLVEKVSPTGKFNRVQIKLKSFKHTALGDVSLEHADKKFDR